MSGLLALLLLGAPQAPGAVLVLPAEGPAGDTSGVWIGEAVADVLPRDLALLGVPAVERQDRLRAQESMAIPQAPLTRATAIRIAESLGASRLVVGSHEAEGTTLTLSLRLLDVEHGTLSSPLRASGPIETLGELIHGLAWDVALAGSTRPTRNREDFLKERAGLPFEALRAYAQGLASTDAALRVKLLKKALGLAPGFDEARLALGRIHLQAREHVAAYEALGRVPASSPFSRSARFLQGLSLVEMGRYRDAAGLYAALASDDPSAAVLNNNALALLRLGAAAPAGVKASDVLRKAMELAPGAKELPFNLGWALLSEGDAEAAAFWLRGVTRQQPADVQARLLLVWALRQARKADEADEEWKGLTAVAPSYSALATPDLTRRFERILPSERLLAMDDDGRSDAELAAVHLGRAEKLGEGGDRDAARREVAQAVVLDPYNARSHLLLAHLHLADGDREKALAELRMALWCKEDAAVRLELAQLLKQLDRGAEARAELERVLKDEPGNAAARQLLEKP